MNALEKIGLNEMYKHLWSALDRCQDKNEDRMQHERIFIKGDIERALATLKALEENSGK